MEQDINREEKIDRYINNLMLDAEKSLFEKEMEENNELKAEILMLLEWRRLFNNHKSHEWEQRIKQAIKEDKERISIFPAKKKPGAVSIKYALGMVALLLFVITVSVFYLTNNKKDVVQLAKESSLDGLNKGAARKEDSIAVAEQLFYSGSYLRYIEKAISLLKENPKPVERSILNINICKSYIQLDQADEAILFYQSLSAEEKEYCYLQFQAALAYTINNSKKEAIQLFESVVNAGCFPVDEKATEWIKKLK